MTALEQHRKEKDDYFAHDRHSPLTAEQKKTFTGLQYFPENPALRLTLTVALFEPKEEVHVQTTKGDYRIYARYGSIDFEVEGLPVKLTVYEADYGFFLPFVDGLAGSDTYPAGRYLEPELLPDGRLLVDFNVAYNPYCAYNDRWSCPLTPLENRVAAPIRAGEKIFHAE